MTEPTPPAPPSPSPSPSAVQKVGAGLAILKDVVVEIATLKRPVTAAAVASLILTQIPGIGLSAEEIAVILVGVGSIDAVLEKFIK